MKVCTDACLLGAYAASKLHGDERNILDIGTGTGLLSLMLAQKSTAQIDAVELDKAAATQATENVLASPWAARIQVANLPIQDFATSKKYDLIISNPPFFEDDLRSTDQQKNNAKHDSGLRLAELVQIIHYLLQADGAAFLLLPFARTTTATTLINQAGLFVQTLLKVKPSPTHDFFRTILVIGKTETIAEVTEMYIHDVQREYSPAFTQLLKDYYLKL